MSRRIVRSYVSVFIWGFVLGAAFMASPAVGLALAVLGAGYLLVFHLKG